MSYTPSTSTALMAPLNVASSTAPVTLRKLMIPFSALTWMFELRGTMTSMLARRPLGKKLAQRPIPRAVMLTVFPFCTASYATRSARRNSATTFTC